MIANHFIDKSFFVTYFKMYRFGGAGCKGNSMVNFRACFIGVVLAKIFNILFIGIFLLSSGQGGFDFC